MKAGSLRLALQAAVLAVALPLAAQAADVGDTSVGGVQAKASYCTDCHGPSGQGYLGWYPIPRLAGQQPEYFANQIKSFVSKNRESDIVILMYKVHRVSPQMERALARHFREANPAPFGGAPQGLVDRGRKSTKREFPTPTFPPALLVTARMRMAKGKTPA